MRAAFAIAAVLSIVTPVAGREFSEASALQRDMDLSLKERPVAKVVRLLKDMLVELNKELEDDKAVFEMLDCWCKTNKKEKEQSIAAGETRIVQLEAEIGEAAAKMAELKVTIAATKEKINKDWSALNEASSMRMKENKEFHGEETDLIAAIKACEQALVVLGKHHPNSAADFAQIRSAAHGLRDVRPGLLTAVLDGDKVEMVKEFMSQAEHPDSFLGVNSKIPGVQSYNPQSGQILGILSQMKEEFEGNLKTEQESEATAKADFESMKAAKEQEIAASKKLLKDAEDELAEVMEKHAAAIEELSDTKDQVAIDKEFLEKLLKRCRESEAEFAKRVKSRNEEIVAVQDTIGFLNSDEAFDMFTKTVNTAFVQSSAVHHLSKSVQDRRKQAVAVLQKMAASTGSQQLAMVMTAVQLDAFDKVIAMIDEMIEELKKQQADEVEEHDWCIAELDKTTLALDKTYDQKADLETKIADLEATIKQLTETMESHKKEIADMQTEMKRASEDREAQNVEYQQVVSDQRVTQAILKKALDRMGQVYSMLQQGQPGAPHIQTSGTATDPGNGPARFTENKQNAGGKRVLVMIEGIIKDSKNLEEDAVNGEQDSQTAYENFMQDSNKSIKKLEEALVNMTEEKAKNEESLTMTKEDFRGTMKELENLHATEASLHKDCDYLIKNFSLRQEARLNEIDALGQAKAILSGMK